MGIPRCVYPGCSVRSGQGTTLYNFPFWMNDLDRRRRWLELIGLQETDLSGDSRICQKHFDDQFLLRMPNGPDRLKKDAVPLLFCAESIQASESGTQGESSGAREEPMEVIDEPMSNPSEQHDRPILPAPPSQSTPQSSQHHLTMSSGGTTASTGVTGSGASSGSSFIPSPERQFIEAPVTENRHPPGTDACFIIEEDKLRLLFQRCQVCGEKLNDDVRFFQRGGHLRVETFCPACSKTAEWNSHQFINHMSSIYLLLPTSTIVAGKTFEDLAEIASGMKLAIPSKSEFYNVANNYVYPAVRKLYNEEHEELLNEVQERQKSNDGGLQLAMDSRYSQPGHSATYATTSAMDLKTNKILSSVVTVKHIDAESSPALELQGTRYVLSSILNPYDEAEDCSESSQTSNPMETSSMPIRVSAVVTDDHSSIIKYMRESYPDIDHQGDPWHFIKRVAKRLGEVSKKADCRELLGWIKSITNFIWTICQECLGDPILLEEMWRSILYHVRGIHKWPKGAGFERFHECRHDVMDTEKQDSIAWLEVSTPPYRALQIIINDKRLLVSLRRCSLFLHTSKVESFHSSLLKFLSKRLAFDPEAFKARVLLAIMRFNENIDRPLALTSTGDLKTRMALPPSTKSWTAKAQLVEMTSRYRDNAIQYAIDERKSKSTVLGHHLGESGLRAEPTQASFVDRPSREEMDEQFRNKRHRMQ